MKDGTKRNRGIKRTAGLMMCTFVGATGCLLPIHVVNPKITKALPPLISQSEVKAGALGDSLAASTDWPQYGHDTWQTREAPDDSITAASVRRLHIAWQYVIPGVSGSNESFPLESNGQLYATDPNGSVFALNAQTGRLAWTFTPPIEKFQALAKINRGVALDGDSVYVLTPDDWLFRLRARDGRVLFHQQVADPQSGVFESMAPAVAGKKIIVGSAGGDEGIRGFVSAYDAITGRRLWQFYTVPARGTGWMAATGDHGGGTVWTTPTYDARDGAVLFGTGNPSPDYFGKVRPGANPYTDSVVSLNVDSGKLAWARQEVAHDLWDYDVASPPLLFPVAGKLAVGEAGKDGEWYEWDVRTGKPLIKPVPFVKEDHSPPTAQGTEEWPGPNGGANYGPSAFSTQTKDAYISGINGPEVIYSASEPHNGYELDFGTRQNPSPRQDWSGTITAVHVGMGKVAWKIHLPAPAIGGVTINRGGLVWFGRADGMVEAVSETTGKRVWQMNVGAPIGSAPIVYTRSGVTYVVIVTGGAGSLGTLYPWHGASRVVAFSFRNAR